MRNLYQNSFCPIVRTITGQMMVSHFEMVSFAMHKIKQTHFMITPLLWPCGNNGRNKIMQFNLLVR